MSTELNELVSLIEEELAIGEKLLLNLSAQRRAILGWSIGDLMHQIEAREPLLRSLRALEQSREQLMARISSFSNGKPTLKEIIIGFPESRREIAALRHMRGRLQEVYSRVQDEEKALLSLMGNLLEHIHEALSPLTLPSAPVYGEKGIPASKPAASGLIQGKV